MSDQEVTGQLQDAAQPVSPGASLAAHRMERGWTVEQVASQLNLAPRQIVALESDDYPALPGMAVVRGFIRAYAKLLKVDAAPLLVALGGVTVFANQTFASRTPLATPYSERRLPPMTERVGVSSKWIIGSLLAVLIGVAIWASQFGEEIVDLSKSASSQVKEGLANIAGAEDKASSSVAVAENRGEAPAHPQNAAPVSPTEPAATPQVAPAPAVQPSSSAAVEAPVLNPATTGDKTLVLKMNEESWLEIRRLSDKKLVFSRVVSAGKAENVDVNEPLSVVIGNARGVDVSLRGEPIGLQPSTKNNVARLTVK